MLKFLLITVLSVASSFALAEKFLLNFTIGDEYVSCSAYIPNSDNILEKVETVPAPPIPLDITTNSFTVYAACQNPEHWSKISAPVHWSVDPEGMIAPPETPEGGPSNLSLERQ